MEINNKKFYRYPLNKIILIILLLLIFIIGLFFCLNFISNSQMPNNSNIFNSDYSNKSLLVTYLLLPVCIISVIAGLFYLYQYLSMVKITSDYIIKNRFLSTEIKIKLDNINEIKLFRFILLLFIVSKSGKIIILLPSIDNYNEIVTILMNRV